MYSSLESNSRSTVTSTINEYQHKKLDVKRNPRSGRNYRRASEDASRSMVYGTPES